MRPRRQGYLGAAQSAAPSFFTYSFAFTVMPYMAGGASD
jgi:hypothetical protein